MRPNRLLDLDVASELNVDKTGDMTLDPGDISARVQLPDDFDPEPAFVFYVPIEGLTNAVMSPNGTNQVCFRNVNSAHVLTAQVQLGSQGLYQRAAHFRFCSVGSESW